MLSKESNPPIDHVIQAGIVPRLIECLSDNDHPKLQFEAAWSLTNIASGTSEHVKVVVDHGALPPLVVLLKSQDKTVQDQATRAVGNIAGNSPDMRNKVLESFAQLKRFFSCKNLASESGDEHKRKSTREGF